MVISTRIQRRHPIATVFFSGDDCQLCADIATTNCIRHSSR